MRAASACAGLWIATLGCAGTPASPAEPAVAEAPPDLAALRALLDAERARTFAPADVERGCPEGTIGDYLAVLEQNTRPDPSEPDAIVSLEGGCAAGVPAGRSAVVDALWPAPDAAHWLCHVDAYASDAAGESPWHYELRVRVRRGGGLDPEWIACPGLP